MTEYCPRGPGQGGPFKAPFNGEMTWGTNHTCSYCGSLNPEAFLEAVQAGAKLTPTDKNYKVYLDSPSEWNKFYFQHLNEEQMDKFVQLLNDKKINFATPGYFYVTPYFIKYDN